MVCGIVDDYTHTVRENIFSRKRKEAPRSGVFSFLPFSLDEQRKGQSLARDRAKVVRRLSRSTTPPMLSGENFTKPRERSKRYVAGIQAESATRGGPFLPILGRSRTPSS
jgi:hypothetical protein